MDTGKGEIFGLNFHSPWLSVDGEQVNVSVIEEWLGDASEISEFHE